MEVVKCKNCEYFEPAHIKEGYVFGTKLKMNIPDRCFSPRIDSFFGDGTEESYMEVEPDGFCAWGKEKRKIKDEN